MTSILDYIENKGFDLYTTDDTTPIYIKKSKYNILGQHLCCGYDYVVDELSGLHTYTKCNTIVKDFYLCSTHDELEINIINQKNKIIIQDIQEVGNENYLSYYIDNKINNSIYIKRENGKKLEKKYRQYIKCTYTFNFNKEYLIIKFWDKKNKLIFKVLKYINISTGLDNIFHIINLFHDKKIINILQVSLEPISLVYKSIMKSKLQYILPLEIANIIVNKFYLDIDARLIRSYIEKYIIFRDNNPYKKNEKRYGEFKFLLHIFKNLMTLYKIPTMIKLFKTMYTRIDENNKILEDSDIMLSNEDKLELKLIQTEILRFFDIKFDNDNQTIL